MEKELYQEQFPEKPSMDRSEIIENQLNQVSKIELEIGKDKLNVEYQILDCRDEKEIKEGQEKDDKTIIVIPGFPSPLSTFVELNKNLALSGKRVITLSLPGMGGSDNPPEKWLGRHLLEKQSEVVHQLLSKVIKDEQAKNEQKTTSEFSVVGVSLGAPIASKLLKNHKKEISDFILVHPAGITKSLKQELIPRQIYSSLKEIKIIKNKFKDDPEKLQKALDTFQKMREGGAKSGAWKRDRVQQRLTEIKSLTQSELLLIEGSLLEDMKDIDLEGMNVLLMSGSEDRLLKPEQLGKIEKYCERAKNYKKKIIKGTSHGGPVYDAEEYAETIINQLNKWREEELKK